MRRLVALLLAVALAGVTGVAASVCGEAGATRTHCCCHPDAADALGTPCPCKVGPGSDRRQSPLPPSVSGPDRAAQLLAAPAASVNRSGDPVVSPWVAALAPSPFVSPPPYLIAHSFRC
jgi:hypothetical protein